MSETPAALAAEDEQPMAEQAFFPTCMIWAMFLVLGVFMLAIVLWILAVGLGGT